MKPPDYDPQALRQLSLTQPEQLANITILIPTVGRDLLANCLEHILLGSCWPAELLIIDQSRDSSMTRYIDQAASYGLKVRYIRLEATGKSVSLNRGLALVKTRYVTIIDDDCLVDDDWLCLLMQRLESSPGMIVTGRVDSSDEAISVSTITDDQEVIYRAPLRRRDPLYGGNMGLSVQLAAQIGPFDESTALRAAEDNDYGYRALKQGIPILYAPEVRLLHVSWRDEAQRAARYQAYAESQGGFYGKHIRRADWFMLRRFVRDQARGPWRWLRGIWRGNPEDIASGKALTLHLLPGLLAGLRRR